MSKREVILQCVICRKKRHPHKYVQCIDAQGLLQNNQPLCKRCCANRSWECPQCGQLLVVLIDGSAACRNCVAVHYEHLWKTQRGELSGAYAEIILSIPPPDIEEFITLVQKGMDLPNAEPELCWVIALAAYSYRYSLKIKAVIARVRSELQETRSLVDTLLPSGKPEKRFKPNQP